MSAGVAVMTPEADVAMTGPSVAVAPPAASKTLMIFDWDDTLLCSSWLAQNGLRLDTPDIVPADAMAQLRLLEGSVIALLERAATHGEVVVITNAETGWVELSAKKFMPGVLPYLAKLRVVSARSTYEPSFPDSPSAWKVQAFHADIGAAFTRWGAEASKNIISLGDSVHERTALHKVMAGQPKSLTKSVKFVERPTIEQLKRQVDLVHSCLADVVTHKGNLDLMLTIQLIYQ